MRYNYLFSNHFSVVYAQIKLIAQNEDIDNMFDRKITRPQLTQFALRSMRNAAKSLPGMLGFSTIAWVLSTLNYEGTREHDIKADHINDECKDLVMDSSQFEVLGEAEHGSLHAKFVKDIANGEEYVKKGAHSRSDFVKEYMTGNFLHLIRPEQPACKIMQSTDDNGTTHFHLLSHKFPNTVDVEQFLSNGNANKIFSGNMEILGLEATLAADNIVGKQSDTKFANMIVTETPNRLTFASIDNEKAVSPVRAFADSGHISFILDPKELALGIADLGDKSVAFGDIAGFVTRSELAGTEIAKEFRTKVNELVKKENLAQYYEDVSKANIEPLISDCHRLAKHTRLFKHKECDDYRKHYKKIQGDAKTHAERMKSNSM